MKFYDAVDRLPPDKEAVLPCKAPTGIEPVQSDSRPVPRDQALGRILVDATESKGR